MSDPYTVRFEGDHVRVDTDAADRDLNYARSLWGEVMDACREHDCFDVLGVSMSSKPQPTMYAYAYAEMFQDLGFDGKFRIAWAELNEEARITTRFAETVLINRDLPGKVFDTEEDARKWLIRESGA